LLLAGRDESDIARWVSEKGLESRVHLAGFVPYERMADHYRLAKAFVLPSLPLRGWNEQFGYVLAEAMACGIPVLGSDAGAIPEAVGDRERLFPPGDSQALADRLLAFRRRSWAAASRAARRRALSLYSSERLARDLARFYGEALSLSPAPTG
jgi:glycosyltransferase involved in cell wall biosynthesis